MENIFPDIILSDGGSNFCDIVTITGSDVTGPSERWAITAAPNTLWLRALPAY